MHFGGRSNVLLIPHHATILLFHFRPCLTIIPWNFLARPFQHNHSHSLTSSRFNLCIQFLLSFYTRSSKSLFTSSLSMSEAVSYPAVVAMPVESAKLIRQQYIPSRCPPNHRGRYTQLIRIPPHHVLCRSPGLCGRTQR